jgi:hypothetical protein
MKYLKIYEHYNSKLEIKEFCGWYLATLLDTGGILEITESKGFYWINIYVGSTTDDSCVEWNQLKDYIIPFLIVLSEKYDLEDDVQLAVKFKNMKVHYKLHFELDDVINDNLDFNQEKAGMTITSKVLRVGLKIKV